MVARRRRCFDRAPRAGALFTALATLSASAAVVACGASDDDADVDHASTGTGPGGGPGGGGAGTGGATGAGSGGGGAPVDPLTLRPLYTEHLGQLTSTAKNPIVSLGMRGTDLGSSFERDGELLFLFGDTMGVDHADDNRDSIAHGPLALPGDGSMPALSWFTEPGATRGGFLPLVLPGVDLGPMNVPVEGVAVGATTFLFFTTHFDFPSGNYQRSTVAHATGAAFDHLIVDHDVPSAHFLNVSVVVADDGTAWIFGTGEYRKSAVYLAQVPAAQLGDRSAWRYLASGGGFAADESAAIPAVPATSAGELSVRRHPSLGVWMMSYAQADPRGTVLLLAPGPTGPWTAPAVTFDPAVRGYEHVMHAKESFVQHDDGLSGLGAEEDWGGEYAPYLVPSFCTPTSIVFAMSSWNPYQVHLMRTWLGPPGATYTPPARGAGLPKTAFVNGDFATGDLRGWQTSGDAFGLFDGADGAPRVTTYAPGTGDAATGAMWQDLAIDATTSELSFWIAGGDGRVTLTRGDDVVRSSHGRRDNTNETRVVWNVEEYRGETVRVTVVDDLTAPWGFVQVRGFAAR